MSQITLKIVIAALFAFTLMIVVSQLITDLLEKQKRSNNKMQSVIAPTQVPVDVPPPEQITQGYRENYVVNLYSDRMVVPKQDLYQNDNISFLNNDDKAHQIEFGGKSYTVKVNEMLGFSIQDSMSAVDIMDTTLNQSETIIILNE